MAHIFISYSHNDADFVLKELSSRLTEIGFELWIDRSRLRAGYIWREEIDRAIRSAYALIVVITPSSMNSHYVTYEWACAWGANIPVVPILLQDATSHPRLEALQHLDFRRWHDWDGLRAALLDGDSSGEDTIPPENVANMVTHLLENALDGDGEAMHRLRAMGNEVIEPLIANLLIEEVNIRNAAATALQQRGHDAKLMLLDALRSSDPEWRIAAIRGLSILQLTDAVIPILMALQDEDLQVRSEARIGLVNGMGSVSIAELGNALRDPHVRIRHNTVEILGEIGDYQATPYLIHALRDDNESVRIAVAEALGHIGSRKDVDSSEIVEHLLEVLRVEDDEVSYSVIIALGRIGGRQAIPDLVKIVRDTKREETLRLQAMALLDRLDAHEVIAPAIQILSDSETSILLKEMSINVLGNRRKAASLPTLVSMLQHEQGNIVNQTLIAIGKTGGREAVPILSRFLAQADPNRRVAAIRGLGESRSVAAIPHLANCLSDRNRSSSGDRVCDVAAEQLESLNLPEAQQVLHSWQQQR